MTSETSLLGTFTPNKQEISANLFYKESQLGEKMTEECQLLYERYLFHVKSNLSEQVKHLCSENVYLSSVKDITLNQFIVVRKWYCKFHHKNVTFQTCVKCQQLILLAEMIRDEVFCELSSLYRKIFPNLKYQSDKAIRKLMQLPVVIFKLQLHGPGSQKLYICERRQMVDYKAFSQLCHAVLSSNQKQEKGLTREAMDVLCSLASTESDRRLIKYSVCKSQGLSAKAALQKFGFNDFHKKEEDILRAVEEAKTIRQAVMQLASVKNKCTLRSLGYDISDDSDASNSDNSDFEDDDCDESVRRLFPSDVSDAEDREQAHGRITSISIRNEYPSNEMCQNEQVYTDQPVTGCSSGVSEDLDLVHSLPSMEHMLFMLRANELNWFAFVGELKMLLTGLTSELLDQVLIDFAHHLSRCNLDGNEERLVEQSRQTYLERERECITAEESDTCSDSESDNPNDWAEIHDITSQKAKEMVAKQWKRLKQRSRTKAAKAIVKAGLLKRRVTKKVSSMMQKYPNIGI